MTRLSARSAGTRWSAFSGQTARPHGFFFAVSADMSNADTASRGAGRIFSGPEDEAEFVYQGVVHRITDILMRMLAPRELYTAQGFPPDYIIDRLPDGKRLTKTAQIRMCGNSVPPELVEALVSANGPDTWIQKERPAHPLLTLLKACFAVNPNPAKIVRMERAVSGHPSTRSAMKKKKPGWGCRASGTMPVKPETM